MLKHKEDSKYEYFILNFSDIQCAKQDINKPMQLDTKEHSFSSCCIHCAEPLCMVYKREETKCDFVENFPYLDNNNVCPTDSISFVGGKVCIDDTRCIRCGICVSRCSLGALYFKKNGKVAVNDLDSKICSIIDLEQQANKQQAKLKKCIINHTKYRNINALSIQKIEDLYNNIKGNNIVSNLLIRNLLIQVGFSCGLRRDGDVYTRMDAIYENKECLGPIEIEYNDDSLSIVRNFLDDIAVMNERYEISPDLCTPLAVTIRIPNTRQSYYQVCDDVNKLYGIKVRTITVGALLCLVWSGRLLSLCKDMFKLSFRSTSILQDLEFNIGFELPEAIAKSSFIEASK